MPRPGFLAFVLTIMACLAVTATAQGQELDTALDLEEAGHLEDALEVFEELLATGANDRRDLATIYQHLAVLRFAAGDRAGARAALMRLLAVSPTATLSDSAPPGVQRLFDRAVERWDGRTLGARIREQEPDGDEVVLRVRVVDDVAELVDSVEVLDGADVVAQSSVAGPNHELPLSLGELSSEEGELTVALLDTYGGTLWEGTHELEAQPPRSRRRRGGDGDDGGRGGGRGGGRPLWQSVSAWSLVGVGAVGVIAGGIALGVDDTPTGAQTVIDGMLWEERRRTAAGGGAVLALGAVAGLGGMLWLILTRRRGDPDADDVSLTMPISLF